MNRSCRLAMGVPLRVRMSARPSAWSMPLVSYVPGPAATLRVRAVMARLRRLRSAQPASAGGAPPAPWARGQAATAARPQIPRGRHRTRTSRRDDAVHPPRPAMTGPPATRGCDADEAVAVLYHAHYCALTRLAALLVSDVAAAEEIVQAAYATLHGASRHLRDSEKALAYLLRKVVIQARSCQAARLAPPSQRLDLPRAGQPAITAPQALVAALRALPARQREALVLRYYAGLPDAQIAAAMGTSARAVTGHIGRGMTTLLAAQNSATVPARHRTRGE